MSWIQIEITIDINQHEKLESMLLQLGANSITFQDAKDNPIYKKATEAATLWNNMVVKALFSANANMQIISSVLQNKFLDNLKISYYELKDKDWETEWRKDFHPIHFGRKLWVCPSEITPPDPLATNVIIDPGCGFGTGSHPTTAMCLEWLESQNLQHKNIIDYGCGSGILAIAASMLGAKSVTAVDIDQQALDETKKNAIINNTNIHVLHSNNIIDSDNKKFDIIIANILSGELIKLLNQLTQLTSDNTEIILSGILEEQAKKVINAYSSWNKMNILNIREGWTLLHGGKKKI